jgi:hypothetical protein
MNTTAENEVLNEAMSELEWQAQWEPTLADDETSSQSNTPPQEGWADQGEPEETTSEATEIDDSLFEETTEVAEQTPQVTEEAKALDRERVKQATIDNSIKKVVSDDWAIDEEKFATLPEWVQKEINLQFSEPEVKPQTDVKAEVRASLEAEREEVRFQELKQNVWKLTPAQQQALGEEFKDNRSHNMTKAKSLEKAMRTIWLWTQQSIQKAKEIWFQRWQAAFPVNAQSPQREIPLENKDVQDMNEDEVIKMVKGW